MRFLERVFEGLWMNDAIEKANSDWNSQCAWHLANGLAGADQPRLTEASPFYVKGLSEYPGEEFASTYNSRIKELLMKHGVPSWAPEQRVPDRKTALGQIVDFGQGIDEYVALSKSERTFFRLSKFWWNENGPHLGCRDEARGFLFLVGEENSRCGSILVYDYQVSALARRYEYLRKHAPSFPFLSKEPAG